MDRIKLLERRRCRDQLFIGFWLAKPDGMQLKKVVDQFNRDFETKMMTVPAARHIINSFKNEKEMV